MSQTLDTSLARTIKHNGQKTLLHTALMLVLCASAAWSALSPGDGDRRYTIVIASWFVAAVCGYGTALLIVRLARRGRPALKLSPDGIWFERFGETVPWSDVVAVGEWKPRHAPPRVQLKLSAGAEMALRRGSLARLVGSIERGMGADGIVISAATLSIGHSELLELMSAYFSAYGPPTR